MPSLPKKRESNGCVSSKDCLKRFKRLKRLKRVSSVSNASKTSKTSSSTPSVTSKAQEKAQRKEEERKSDQSWINKHMEDGFDQEVYLQASRQCATTTLKNGEIRLGCPIPKKLQYCVSADKSECKNGNTHSSVGCKLGASISQALESQGTKIDGNFVSEAEGGSYRSPYVPWGPISGATKDRKPILTKGNNSGVTVGTGVDLGAISNPEKYIERLKKVGVSEKTIETIKPFLGKKQREACEALRESKKAGLQIIPEKDVELIDLDAISTRVPVLKNQFEKERTRYIKSLQKNITNEEKKTLPNQEKIDQWKTKIENAKDFDSLDSKAQTILMSSLYHEGTIRKSAKAFVQALIADDEIAAKKALEKKTHHGNSLIASRGKRELELFNKNEPLTKAE